MFIASVNRSELEYLGCIKLSKVIVRKNYKQKQIYPKRVFRLHRGNIYNKPTFVSNSNSYECW